MYIFDTELLFTEFENVISSWLMQLTQTVRRSLLIEIVVCDDSARLERMAAGRTVTTVGRQLSVTVTVTRDATENKISRISIRYRYRESNIENTENIENFEKTKILNFIDKFRVFRCFRVLLDVLVASFTNFTSF